jgi:hypothetical protein
VSKLKVILDENMMLTVRKRHIKKTISDGFAGS